MTTKEAIAEAWLLYDLESAHGACTLARIALQEEVANLARPGRCQRREVMQNVRDLQRDGVIASGLRTRIRKTYGQLSGPIHGDNVAMGEAGELINRVTETAVELRQAGAAALA